METITVTIKGLNEEDDEIELNIDKHVAEFSGDVIQYILQEISVYLNMKQELEAMALERENSKR